VRVPPPLTDLPEQFFAAAVRQKLMGAKSPEKAIEVQSEYIKMAYEGFVAEATKIGELYADIAKASYKPFEGLIDKKTSAT
jgi:hypothetical protein